MAIQVRRGVMQDFDQTKMLPGEFAVILSGHDASQITESTDTGQAVYVSFSQGGVKRLSTYGEIEDAIRLRTESIISKLEESIESSIVDMQSTIKKTFTDYTTEVGTVHTVDSSEPAKVTNVGEYPKVVLDFDIPRGATGPKGDTGDGAVVTEVPSDYFGFHINDEGHLIMSLREGDPVPPITLRADGHLIYTIDDGSNTIIDGSTEVA